MSEHLRPCPHCHTYMAVAGDPAGPGFCHHCGGDLGAIPAVKDIASALFLLEVIGAPPHLVRHHQLVAEAATELVEGLCTYNDCFDGQLVCLGAALHDAGKVTHPQEMHGPGHRHEPAGVAALQSYGLHELARFCQTHAQWDAPGVAGEDLLVALADKLWKGKRVAKLEQRAIAWLAEVSGRDFWDVFTQVDSVFEKVAQAGPTRIARSRQPPNVD